MGYDLSTINSDEDFRANIWGMQILRGAMKAAGCLEWDTNPEWPKGPWNEETNPSFEAVKKVSSPQPGKVPGIKFCSNDGWIVTEKECGTLADALLKLLDEEEEIFYQKYSFEKGGYERQIISYSERQFVQEFAEYCRKAAGDGGFTVW